MITYSYLVLNLSCLISSLIVVSGNTAIIRMIFLILSSIFASLIYIILDFLFLGLTYIIVYAGALAIIFLFIIMLVPTRPEKNRISPALGGFILLLLVTVFLILALITTPYGIYSYNYSNYFHNFLKFTDIYYLGISIYLVYPIVLLFIGVLLWAVMIGILDIVT